ncbi:MAG TPA: nucleoside diphosphate kinase regulator [Steroidobacteraceae bacterium]|jgi:regulator of nucleoside diphosphate kinase
MSISSLHLPAGRPAIFVAEGDARRLTFLLHGDRDGVRDVAHLRELRDELERAIIVAPQEIPAGVITMYSVIAVHDLTAGSRREITLVYPHEAEPAAGRISVLAPLGTALLGYREGDEVEWLMPGGVRRLRIESVRSAHETAVRH